MYKYLIFIKNKMYKRTLIICIKMLDIVLKGYECMSSKYKTYAIRLPHEVAEYYEQLAMSDDMRASKLIAKILTNDFQSIGIKHQADRMENIVDNFEVKLKEILENFSQKNLPNNKFFDDFGGMYIMLLSLLNKHQHTSDEIKQIQSKGVTYSQVNYKADNK